MEQATTTSKPPGTISVSELHERLQAGGSHAGLVDVRTGAEFEGSHVAGARSMPLDELDAGSLRAASRGAAPGLPVYVMCRSGQRSRTAVEKLRAQGIGEAVGIEGGLLAWEAAGFPVERGARQVISLERQVRIGAGSLVVLGAVLGTWVHPCFYGLSAFVGAGLVFAGATDTCGMGMMLVRMPWNNARPASGCALPSTD